MLRVGSTACEGASQSSSNAYLGFVLAVSVSSVPCVRVRLMRIDMERCMLAQHRLSKATRTRNRSTCDRPQRS